MKFFSKVLGVASASLLMNTALASDLDSLNAQFYQGEAIGITDGSIAPDERIFAMVQKNQSFFFHCPDSEPLLRLAQRLGFKGTKTSDLFNTSLVEDVFMLEDLPGWDQHPIINCDEITKQMSSVNPRLEVVKNDANQFAMTFKYDPNVASVFHRVHCTDFYRDLGVDFKYAKESKADVNEVGLECFNSRDIDFMTAESGNTAQLIQGNADIKPIIFDADEIIVVGRSDCGLSVDLLGQTISGRPTGESCAIDLVATLDNGSRYEKFVVEVFRLPNPEPEWADLLNLLPNVDPIDKIFFRKNVKDIDLVKEIYGPDMSPEDVIFIALNDKVSSPLCKMGFSIGNKMTTIEYNGGLDVPNGQGFDLCSFTFKTRKYGSGEDFKEHTLDVFIVNEAYRKN